MKRLLILVISVVGILGFYRSIPSVERPYVNVYDWFGVLSSDILHDFEKETGIQVRYDVYDNNDVLEAKLLAGHSGYDLVFPSLSPYVIRQVAFGLYQKIDYQQLPNWVSIDPWVLGKAKDTLDYALPYYWGSLGIVVNEDLIPNPEYSWGLLFDPHSVQKYSHLGMTFLSEPVDVLPMVSLFLGHDPKTYQDQSVFKKALHHVKRLRPSIRHFSAGKFVYDLSMGDVAIAQAWSGEANRTVAEAKALGKKLTYFIPKEGSLLWVDCMAIPKDAPHPHNAHLFINFLLRPDISGRITNRTRLATTVLKSYAYLDPDVARDPNLIPDQQTRQRLHVIPPLQGEQGRRFEQFQALSWWKMKIGG